MLSVCQEPVKQACEVYRDAAPAGNAECDESGGEGGEVHAESFGRGEEEERGKEARAGPGRHSLQET